MPSWPARWTRTCPETSTYRRLLRSPSPEPFFDGVERGEDEIFPDPMSASMAESWRNGAVKALERENAALLTAAPVAA